MLRSWTLEFFPSMYRLNTLSTSSFMDIYAANMFRNWIHVVAPMYIRR